MKRALQALLILPAVAFAQFDFDPVRLDDGQETDFFYPWMTAWPDGNLLCAWAQTSHMRIAAAGRAVSPWGAPVGDPTFFQVVDPGHGGIVCPPEIVIVPHPQGGEAQFVYHA